MISVVFVSALICSCTTLNYESPGGELVVEGWICNNEFPVVMVSRTIPATEKRISVKEVWNYTEYFAKVSISDGTKEEYMVGKKDDRYLPAYQYTSSFVRGAEGKTYTIKVKTEDGLTASCTAKINKSVRIDSIRAVKLDSGDYSIEVTFNNSISDSLYYHFYTCVEGKDKVWVPSILGTIDGSRTDGPITAIVNRGRGISGSGIKLAFSSGERVNVRLCTMGKKMFDYWSAFDDAQTIAENPFVPSKDNLPPVVDGAKGYWTGYGVYDTVVDIP